MRYRLKVNRKDRRTLAAIYEEPVRSDVAWRDIEALFRALGAVIIEGRGSRVRIVLHQIRASFHLPHPRDETNKGALRSVRRFLDQAGVRP